MDNEKIEKLLDHLTLGLRQDPETRLEVKSELRSHLEAKIEEGIKGGLSEEKSTEQALKAFGDTIQISDEIADANTSKMSLKAKLRMFAGFLLVPTVILCALLTFEPSKARIRMMPHRILNVDDSFYRYQNSSDKVFWLFNRYTPEQELILYGDPSLRSRAEGQKAICERFPDNKIYLANYIITLLAEKGARNKLLTELELAKQKDPDNAFYNYLTAGLLLEKACKEDSKSTYPMKNGKKDRKNAKTEYILKIKDRKLMDQAVDEYLAGTRKKYCKTYVTDMLQCKFDIMGKPDSLLENIRQIATAAGVLLPYLNKYRSIPRGLWKYAEVLQKEGKQQQALRIVAPWEIYLKQTTSDADFLISILVNMAVAKIAKDLIPPIYRRAGKLELAEKYDHELTNICKVKDDWRSGIGKNNIDKEILRKAGILTGMLMPALGPMDFEEKDFAASRKIEYSAVEKSLIVFLNAFFLFIMIGALLTALYWRIRSGQKALLLAPAAKFIGKVFLMGILVPICIYGLISVSGVVGGHEYNIGVNATALVAQVAMLLIAIPFIIYNMIREHTRQRCMELGIAVPETKIQKIWKVIFIIIFLIFALFALMPSVIIARFFSPELGRAFALFTGLIFVLTIILLLVKYFFTLFRGKEYAFYYGALAKTIAPVFALAMIFMTLVVIPCLEWREADLIDKDKIMYGQPRSFTHVEHLVTERLKTDMLKAMD